MAIIHIPNSSIFDSKAQTLVNPVNCVGVMGKGLAKEFKARFPDMFLDYHIACVRGLVKLGEPYLSGEYWEKQHSAYDGRAIKRIVNFPTKNDWRDQSYPSDIATGLDYLRSKIPEWGITSLALPALGCGNGGLLWSDVRDLIHASLGNLPFDVEVYLPH